MKTTASPSTSTWLEGRRFRAWQLKQQGWTQRDIAKALGVTEGAVGQWMKRVREGGAEALRHQPPPGPAHRLSPEQRAEIPTRLARGAEAYGFRGDLWTTKRVAIVIEREFGVRYHPAHVSRLLRELGWSVQKPVEKATQRNEAAIEAWKNERWPDLQRGPKKKAEPSSG
jgi:transposase